MKGAKKSCHSMGRVLRLFGIQEEKELLAMSASFITLLELKKVFPEDLPKDVVLTKMQDQMAIDATEALRGKKWADAWSILIADFEIPYWLTPFAFNYYFPAYILASQTNLENSFLAISFVIPMFRPRHANDLRNLEWVNQRLSLFDHDQRRLMVSWFDWLEPQTMDDPAFIKDIEEARQEIKKRLGNNK